MVYVTAIVDEDVLSKIDTAYVASKFSDVDLNASIILVCLKEDARKEQKWRSKGEWHYTVHLPHEAVKNMPDVRPLILEAVARRLGVPAPIEVGAVAA